MSGHPVSFAELDDLVDALKANDLHAAIDPADLNPPGVLVQLQGVTFDILDGYSLGVRLAAVAPDTDYRRSMTILAGLLTKVVEVINPTDTVQAATIPLPAAPGKLLPALAVPVTLRIT